jgi:hypothetical protein
MAMTKATGALMIAAGFAMGCTMSSAPRPELALSEAAVAMARQAGAAEAAPLELRLAEEKLRLGKRWIAAGDHKPARWLVEQAQVDAELAAMKAMSARARLAAARETEEFRAGNSKLAQRTN